MSSNSKTTATKEEAKPALVPKLRFPAFRGAEPWKVSGFDEVLSPVARERPKPAIAYMGLGLRSHGKGTFLKPLQDPAKNSMDQLYEVKANDLIVNITFAWEGAVAIAQECDEGALVSHRFPTYTFEKGGTTPEFFRYIILDKQFVYSLGVISPGGAGINRVLSKNDFLKLRVALPSPAEQQKIAECLSSMDELMAAQARKVEALKTHKKGLMQQLFPREGETQPRRRFPEFQNTGEWEDDTLGTVCELYQPVTLSSSQLSMTGEHLVYGANGVIGTHNEYNHEESEITVTCRGATCGEMTTTSSKSWITGNAMVVKPRSNKLRKDFIFQYFKNHGLKTVISGSAQPQITRAGLAPLVIFFPKPDEQERIASCLSRLDALIPAETQKLEALKTHKKGLMQQIFPSPEEVEA